ncbi:B12-binding domain-containing radical SAM protein [Desulfogranum japonicum]|uniref:B12-binding domain-containing radical SAM protein n=1 Tax=Desulfogranum japonicum TaxID=231447 RepID=UPI0003FF665B|nr:radical SAM protein [Desulfogranum japonicum]
MKVVVLEHPRLPSKERFNDIANTPLWSCLMGGYASAALEHAGFATTFLDKAIPGATFSSTKENILDLHPDVLCVNAVYFWEQSYALFDFFTDLKQSGFCGHLTLFGFFPTLIYREILEQTPSIDSIAVGEFELTLPELATSLCNNLALDAIEGLVLRSNLNHHIRRKPEKNPDIFPFPKRSELTGTASILASRGCYNHCSFCPVPSFYNKGALWRGRSPENIVAEMQELIDHGITSFYFCDPNFIGPGKNGKKRILDLMERLKPLQITFGMETRPQDLDDELLTHMVEAGFNSLLMGIESGSKNILKGMDKGSGPDKAAEAIQLCRSHGIDPEVGFLMFVPDADLNSLKENINFLQANHLLNRLDRTANLLSHSQIVLAGTSGYTRFAEKHMLHKQGLFGFEAKVDFSDPAVEWVAILLTYACHQVLRSMGKPDSPIHWQKKDSAVSTAINDYLVKLGCSLIEEAEHKNNSCEETPKERCKKISNEINSLLKGT